MIIVEYDPAGGEPVSDGYAHDLAKEVMDSGDDSAWLFSTENIFYAIRVRIQNGEFPYTSIKFRFQGQDIALNEYANPVEWPENFLGFSSDLALKLIKGGIRLRKSKRNQTDHDNHQ